MTNYVRTDETRKRISEAKKLWWARLKLSLEDYEAYAKKQRDISVPARGRKRTPEQLAKIRKGQEVACSNCGAQLYRSPSQVRRSRDFFCSLDCQTAWRQGQAASRKAARVDKRQAEKQLFDKFRLVERTTECINCGQVFVKERLNKSTKFCSRECFHEWRRKNSKAIKAFCPACGKEFVYFKTNTTAKYGRVFCSRECRYSVWKGKEHPLWKGRIKNRKGYWLVRGDLVPDKYKSMLNQSDSIMEHRLVMAQHLGRPLEDWEVVHHKNGNRGDNQLENLELHPQFDHLGITAMAEGLKRLRERVAELEAENMALRKV